MRPKPAQPNTYMVKQSVLARGTIVLTVCRQLLAKTCTYSEFSWSTPLAPLIRMRVHLASEKYLYVSWPYQVLHCSSDVS